MSDTILWLIGAFAVLGAEMLIGTVYLIAVSAALFLCRFMRIFRFLTNRTVFGCRNCHLSWRNGYLLSAN